MNIPSVKITLDRERLWKLDVASFERACDGFEELGLPEFAENPFASIQEFAEALKGGRKFSRKESKILRVWLWAGLTGETGEDDKLSLADISHCLAPGHLPRLAVEILPPLAESLIGRPTEAAAEQSSAAAATGPLADSASG